MSEPDLREELAALVLAVAGVVRLEPTLPSSLHRLTTAPPGLDGITLHTLTGPDDTHVTEVVADVATSTTAQARRTAHAVQRAVADCLRGHGREPGPIRVNVLSIEP